MYPSRDASAAAEAQATRTGLHGTRQALVAEVLAFYNAGNTAKAITEELGLSRRRVDRRVRLEVLLGRNAVAITMSSPGYFLAHLSRRWHEGCLVATRPFTAGKQLGYTGRYTH